METTDYISIMLLRLTWKVQEFWTILNNQKFEKTEDDIKLRYFLPFLPQNRSTLNQHMKFVYQPLLQSCPSETFETLVAN